jgi:hypothetical protein
MAMGKTVGKTTSFHATLITIANDEVEHLAVEYSGIEIAEDHMEVQQPNLFSQSATCSRISIAGVQNFFRFVFPHIGAVGGHHLSPSAQILDLLFQCEIGQRGMLAHDVRRSVGAG